MHYVQKKHLFLVRLPGISVNLNENFGCYKFQAFANISGNFWKYGISGKFTVLEMSTPPILVCDKAWHL